MKRIGMMTVVMASLLSACREDAVTATEVWEHRISQLSDDDLRRLRSEAVEGALAAMREHEQGQINREAHHRQCLETRRICQSDIVFRERNRAACSCDFIQNSFVPDFGQTHMLGNTNRDVEANFRFLVLGGCVFASERREAERGGCVAPRRH